MRHIKSIEEEFEPHRCIEDAAACSTNFGPVTIAGVDARAIHANPDKIDDIGDNHNEDIIYFGDIHPNQHPAQNLILMPDSSDNNHTDNNVIKLDDDDSSNIYNDGKMTNMTTPKRLAPNVSMISHHRRTTRQKIKECKDQDARTEE